MAEKSLNDLAKMVVEQAKQKGFGSSLDEISVPEKFALIHSEISEAYEAYRNKNIDGDNGVAEELGDAVQRILHLAGILEIDLEKNILDKLEKNSDRIWDWEKLNEKHTN